jgi:hypothetical protein
VTLRGVGSGYREGGVWSTLRLGNRNRSGAACRQLRPVLVYGAQGRTLRPGAVHLETLRGGHWHRVGLTAALGELLGEVGSHGGLRLGTGEEVTLTLRMRLTGQAPSGGWLTLAVAYVPMVTKGSTVAWPVEVTEPTYFR